MTEGRKVGREEKKEEIKEEGRGVMNTITVLNFVIARGFYFFEYFVVGSRITSNQWLEYCCYHRKSHSS